MNLCDVIGINFAIASICKHVFEVDELQHNWVTTKGRELSHRSQGSQMSEILNLLLICCISGRAKWHLQTQPKLYQAQKLYL